MSLSGAYIAVKSLFNATTYYCVVSTERMCGLPDAPVTPVDRFRESLLLVAAGGTRGAELALAPPVESLLPHCGEILSQSELIRQVSRPSR